MNGPVVIGPENVNRGPSERACRVDAQDKNRQRDHESLHVTRA